MGNGVAQTPLRYPTRASNGLLAEIDVLERDFPILKGFLSEILAFLDGKVEGKPNDKKVIKYEPRQKAGPKEPLHITSEIRVFVSFDVAYCFIEGLCEAAP
ncbi:MAG: hypothetical protein ACKO1J_10405 [Tagaea sp.]